MNEKLKNKMDELAELQCPKNAFLTQKGKLDRREDHYRHFSNGFKSAVYLLGPSVELLAEIISNQYVTCEYHARAEKLINELGYD